MPTPDISATSPTDYYTKPLETWTFNELSDVIGLQETAELLSTSYGNVRMLRLAKRRVSVERIQVLQEHVRGNETLYRNAMVTMRSLGAFRRRKSNPQETTA